MASTPLVAWMNPLPMELAPGLRGRRRSVAAKATGRVLDLGGWSDHLRSYRLGNDEPSLINNDGLSSVDEVMMLVRPGDLQPIDSSRDPAGVTRVDAGFDSLNDLGVGQFDTIVSLIRTPLVEDFQRMIGAVDSLLGTDGRLLMLEPVGRTGRIGRIVAIGGSIMRATGGLHLDRDIPDLLRSNGLMVTDLERFEVPTVSAPLRPFIEASARRANSGAPPPS